MSHDPAGLNDISDTARWSAAYRALEHDRPDALFRDPFARRLAAPLGPANGVSSPTDDRFGWAPVIRTLLIDRLITAQLGQGRVDMVVNIPAGMDTRPYRQALPATLRWVEVDLPGLLAEKASALRDEQPVCRLERIGLDLTDVAARWGILEQLGREAEDALVITEGLLIYWTSEAVAQFARDLACAPGKWKWILDLQTPALLRLLQRTTGRRLKRAGAPLEFAPEEGAEFFRCHGWRTSAVCSILEAATEAGRVSNVSGPFPQRVDGMVCLLEKNQPP